MSLLGPFIAIGICDSQLKCIVVGFRTRFRVGSYRDAKQTWAGHVLEGSSATLKLVRLRMRWVLTQGPPCYMLLLGTEYDCDSIYGVCAAL